MAITVPPENYVGQLLYLKPGYGWGWHGQNYAHIDYALIDAAGGCHVRVLRFFTWRGEVRGLVGKVDQPGHLFDKLWIVCGEMIMESWRRRSDIFWRDGLSDRVD